MIKVLTTERHKGGTRISFVCGGRALRAMQLRTTLLNTLTADLSCALADLPDIISKLRETNAAAEKTLRTLQERLSEYKAASLIATAEPRGTVRLILHVEENGDPSELRLLAARIVREPGVIALLATVGDRVQVLCARSPDLNAEMNAVLQAVLAALGGKGGGQPALAQGGAPAAEAQQVIQALRTAAEQLW